MSKSQEFEDNDVETVNENVKYLSQQFKNIRKNRRLNGQDSLCEDEIYNVVDCVEFIDFEGDENEAICYFEFHIPKELLFNYFEGRFNEINGLPINDDFSIDQSMTIIAANVAYGPFEFKHITMVAHKEHLKKVEAQIQQIVGTKLEELFHNHYQKSVKLSKTYGPSDKTNKGAKQDKKGKKELN